MGTITIVTSIIFAIIIIFIFVWLYLNNKSNIQKNKNEPNVPITGDQNQASSSTRTIVVLTQISLIIGIFLIIVFWPSYIYLTYLFGAAVILLLLFLIYPVINNKATFGLIMLIFMGISGVLIYFGIREILIGVTLGNYDGETGNTRLS